MANKPRVFFNIHYLELGGAERALLGLLNALDPAQVDIDLMVNEHHGPFMPLVPDYVNLLPEYPRYATIEQPMVTNLRRGQWDILAGRVLSRIPWLLHRLRTGRLPEGVTDQSLLHYIRRYTVPLQPSLKKRLGRYDAAVSFLHPHLMVAKKINARKKIAWIHTDYTKAHINARAELPIWGAYDHIVSISPDVTRTFTQVFPTLADRIVEIGNIVPSDFVHAQAAAMDVSAEMPGRRRIVSVGRHCFAKNFESIPAIAKLLVERHGIGDLQWYIIGPGDDTLTRQAIAATGMDAHVHLLGHRTNPYPYMAAADVYVQPSRYEGNSVTVREAQILCLPTVIADYATAPSQIIHGQDGLIADQNPGALAQAIASVIKNPAVARTICQGCAATDHTNTSQAQKFLNLLNP